MLDLFLHMFIKHDLFLKASYEKEKKILVKSSVVEKYVTKSDKSEKKKKKKESKMKKKNLLSKQTDDIQF